MFQFLVHDENLVAVEIHQRSTASNDISFDLELTASREPRGITREPYLQQLTSTSVYIGRGRDDPSLPPFQLTPSPTVPPMVTPESRVGFPGVTTYAAQIVQGLDPDTLYTYTTEGSEIYSFRTLPPPGVAKPLRIWALGDSGSGGPGAIAVRDAYYGLTGARRTDLILLLGDNALQLATQEEYQAGLFGIYQDILPGTVLWPTVGDHDGLTHLIGPSKAYLRNFVINVDNSISGVSPGPSIKEYYSWNVGEVHFISLDSYSSSRMPGSPMLTWLAADLAANNAVWAIAFWHHSPHSRGGNNSDTDNRAAQMRRNALPILENAGVDLVLGGGSRSYERSFLIDSHYGVSTNLLPSMVLDGGDGDPFGDGVYQKPAASPASHSGTVYVVAGSAALLAPFGATLDHPAMHASHLRLGSLVLDIDDNVLQGRFLTDSGEILDTFTIVKGNTESGFFIDGFESGDTSAW